MNPTQHVGTGAIAEIDVVVAEIVEELRAMRDMLTLYRETVADAARCIARALAGSGDPTLPATDPAGHDLASALARMGGVSAEVDALLSVPVVTLPAAVAR